MTEGASSVDNGRMIELGSHVMETRAVMQSQLERGGSCWL